MTLRVFMNIVIILHAQLSILGILMNRTPKSVTPFLGTTDRQTDKQTDRQTDIEHGFFEASTQKAPSGQKIALRGEIP